MITQKKKEGFKLEAKELTITPIQLTIFKISVKNLEHIKMLPGN